MVGLVATINLIRLLESSQAETDTANDSYLEWILFDIQKNTLSITSTKTVY